MKIICHSGSACFFGLIALIFCALSAAHGAEDIQLRAAIFIDLEAAKSADDYRRFINERLECKDGPRPTCDWEASELLFAWLTDRKVSKDVNYGPELLFQLFQRCIDSGAADVLGIELNSVYGFGMFGVAKDDELGTCWTRINLTTSDKTSAEECQEIELKKYGKKSPWLVPSK
jgi:hypothetical protein